MLENEIFINKKSAVSKEQTSECLEKIKNGEEEREAARQDKLKAVKEYLAVLRQRDYSEIIFEDVLSLNEQLENKDYFQQLAILEYGVKNGKLPIENAIELSGLAKGGSTWLAIIESLPEYQAETESEKAAMFLEEICINYLKNLKSSPELSYWSATNEEDIYFNDKGCQYDPQDNEDYGRVNLAAIKSLAKIEKFGEKRLIEIFTKRFKNRQQEWTMEDVLEDDIILNKRGNLDEKSDYQDVFDSGHIYNSEILRILAETGSRDAIDFAINFIKTENDALFVCAEELTDIFRKIDSKYAAEKLLEILSSEDLKTAQIYSIIQPLADLSVSEATRERFEKAFDKLKQNNAGAATLACLLSSAKEQGFKMDYEQIKDLKLDITDFGQGLAEEDKKEMLAMAEINWRQNENMKDAVLGGLAQNLNDTDNQKFYNLKYKEKLVSFIRFAKTDRDDTLFARSFNVDPDARGLGIGDEVMERALVEEGKEKILEATVSPRIPAGTAYVERVGFVIDGMIPDYHHTNEPLFTIRLDNKQNERYAYRNEGKEQAIDTDQLIEKEKGFNCQSLADIKKMAGLQTIVLKLDMNDSTTVRQAMELLLVSKDDNGKNIAGQTDENKYAATRYFRDKEINDTGAKKKEDIRYFVLEKLS